MLTKTIHYRADILCGMEDLYLIQSVEIPELNVSILTSYITLSYKLKSKQGMCIMKINK